MATGGWAWSDVEIAVPRPSLRLPGVSMAGFRQRAPVLWDIAMVPHPSVTLLIDLSEGDGALYAAGVRDHVGSVVIGLLPGDLRATGRARVECLQIRLEPALAAVLFRDVPPPLTALADVWGPGARRVEERLRAARSWDARFAIATDLLGQQLDVRSGVDPEVAYVWRRTLASRGRVRVDGLADEVGWSRKRLWSRFRAQLGISPKRAARLMRFDHAAHLLAAGHPVADVAGTSGYADQSHLHREVRSFTGRTPLDVAAAPWLSIDDFAWPRVAARLSPTKAS